MSDSEALIWQSSFRDEVRQIEQRARNKRAERIRNHPMPLIAALKSACMDAGTEAAFDTLLYGEVDMSEQAMEVRLRKAMDRIMLDLRVNEVN